VTFRSAPTGSVPTGTAAQPADGTVRKVRKALVMLFPSKPESGPGLGDTFSAAR
jgi:hypothetical protein